MSHATYRPIYIPLCFYFIAISFVCSARAISIYIPLCFYFIIHRINLDGRICWIYIPLCFYFIGVDRSVVPWRRPHLHSTMLLLYPTDVVHKILCFCEFTFHYASTLSYFEAPCSSSHHNLHSTMLLLYHDFASRLTYRVKIYIPLCFYFILSEN